MSSINQYIDLYLQHADLLNQGSHPLINAHRAAALSGLQTHGLPSRKDERYKYTDIDKALAPDYGLNLQRLSIPFSTRYQCRVPGMRSRLYHVVDDTLAGGDILDTPQIFVGPLTLFAERYPEKFKKYYDSESESGKSNALARLNTMLVQDGIVVFVAKGYKESDLLQFINLSAGGVPMLTNRRQLIILESGAEATILACNHSGSQIDHLTNEVVEVWQEEGSKLQYYTIDDAVASDSILNTTHIVQSAGSRLEYASITLSGGLARREVDIYLRGADASVQASGFVVGDGEQHVDNNLLVVHDAPACQSDVLYKYILDGQAVGAFAGKVYVSPGAEQTDSQETNANMCMSPEARMYTQPMLEIYADDVKCNHGSTVGQFNDNALFYMNQRGISPEDGRKLLQQAFAWDVIERIPLLPLRQRLMRMVESRFRLADSCNDCGICISKV